VANVEKHKRNPLQEWMESEEGTTPSRSRSSHLLGEYVKIQKPAAKKVRTPAALNPKAAVPPKPDLALAREPATPAKTTAKQSQAASWDHLKKLERLPNLRRAPGKTKGR